MNIAYTMRAIAYPLLVFGLAACSGLPHPNFLQTNPDAPRSLEATRTIFANRTMVTKSFGHGTQVEYHAADGKSYVWYRENTQVVPAQWKVQEGNAFDYDAICWRYPSTSRNPVTQGSGGNWGCEQVPYYADYLTAVLEGDPFELSTGQVPFIMKSYGPDTVEELIEAKGKSPASLNYIYKKR